MAVLCEAISVVIKAERAIEVFGSFEAFKDIVPNQTLCADNEIIRVGFMVPDDVQGFVGRLEHRGLEYIRNGMALDMVVIDQFKGPAALCDWIEFGQVEIRGNKVAGARHKESQSKKLVSPEGWVFEGSMSHTARFVPTGAERHSLKFLRREDGLDVYFNSLTGTEVYVGRTADRGD
jgi:hypothetical protein